jgi:Na+/melibiose symporter-like transporter
VSGEAQVSPATAERTAPPIGWPTKALYGAGAVAFGVKDNGFSYFLLFFYSQVVGLPAAWVSAALMFALVLDAIFDLTIGQISDNWRSRLGRRHPFMYASVVPVALAYMLLWNPPAGSNVVLLVYLTSMTVIVRIFLGAYEIPSSALVAELTSNYTERTSFFSYRFFFMWWGGLGITLIALRFVLRPDKLHAVGQLNPAGYAHYGVIAALIMAASILTATIGTHGRIPYLKAPPPRRPFHLKAVIGEMFGTLSNPSFVALLMAAVSSNIAIGLGAGLGLYINTYFWELSAGQLSVLLPAAFIGSAFGVLIAPAMSNRFGKRETSVMLAVISVIVSLAPIGLRLVGWFPANGSPLLLPSLFASQMLAVLLGVCANVLISAMLTDVVEESELKTGRRSEGLVLAANTFVAKCVTGVGIFAAGLIVAGVHFPQHAVPGHVAPAVLHNLALLYMPAQGVLYMVAIGFLSRYRITKGGHEANLKLLAERAGAEPYAPIEPLAAPDEGRSEPRAAPIQSPI